MINRLVGMELLRAKELLQSDGIDFEITFYNDKKMNSHDKTLVLRAVQSGDKIQLIATNFLFSPEIKV